MGIPDCSEPPDGRLPADLAWSLEPELRDALDHPIRREILRSLNGVGRAAWPAELARRLGSFRLSQVSYHVQVLAGDGAVVAEGDSPTGGRFYVSDVARESEVTAVLEAMQEHDTACCRAAASGDLGSPSSGVDK